LFGAMLALPARRLRGAAAMLLLVVGYEQVAALMRTPSDPQHVVALASGSVKLRALITEVTDLENGRLRLLLDAEAVRRDDWEAARGLVQLTVGEPHHTWVPGARVAFRVPLRRPRNFGNPGEFDYEGYLARRGIYVTGFLQDDDAIDLLDPAT